MSAPLVFGISGNVKRPSRTAALMSEVTHRLAHRLGADERVMEEAGRLIEGVWHGQHESAASAAA